MPEQQPAILHDSALPKHLLQMREGDSDPDEVLRVTLRLSPRGGDDALLARTTALGREPIVARKHLSRSALAAEIGPGRDAHDAVDAFCRQHGFTVSRTALGGLFVTIEGQAGDLGRAFGVSLGRYRCRDRSFRGYEDHITLPAGLIPHVRAVLGLDNFSGISAQNAVAFSEPPSRKGNKPRVVAFDYYAYPQGLTGQGATVAFIEQDLNVDVDEIQTYYQSQGVGPVSIILEQGSSIADTPDKLNGEAMMDLELTGAVAPGATLIAYGVDQNYGYSSDNWIDALIAALENDTNPCNVMSISLGSPEKHWPAQEALSVNILFAIAGQIGVTICVASGDFGAPGNVDGGGTEKQNCAFPASSPFCLACGGTELVLTLGDPPLLTSEVVWNEMAKIGDKAATGGGISLYFTVPDFQQALTLPKPLNEGQPPGRGMPDVAANAAQNSIYNCGYGTSAAAPMWAALIALMVEKNEGLPIGYLNPRLYELQLGGAHCCKPIMAGNNGPPGSSISFPAGAPWNACCGLGTPLGSNLMTALGIGTAP